MGSKLMKNEAIKMIKTPLSLIRVAAFCLPLALVASCGSEAVQNSTIVISPVDVLVLIGPTSPAGDATIIQDIYTIQVRSPSGNAQVGTEILIDSSALLYDVDSSSGTAVFTLAPTVNGTYRVRTNSNGVYTIAVSYTISGGPSRGVTIFEVFSGTAYGKTDAIARCSVTAPAVCPT